MFSQIFFEQSILKITGMVSNWESIPVWFQKKIIWNFTSSLNVNNFDVSWRIYARGVHWPFEGDTYVPLIRSVFEEISLSKTLLVREKFPNQGYDHYKFALMKTIEMR